MSRQTIFRRHTGYTPPTHALNHGPGPCDQCALEMARNAKQAIFQIHLAESENGEVSTPVLCVENRVATQAEVVAMIAACHSHLRYITDENAQMMDKANAAAMAAKTEEEMAEWGKRERVTKARSQGFVYLMLNRANGFCKIGWSLDPKFREATLASKEPMIETLATTPGTKEDEAALHQEFESKRIRGEWFNLSEVERDEIVWRWS